MTKHKWDILLKCLEGKITLSQVIQYLEDLRIGLEIQASNIEALIDNLYANQIWPVCKKCRKPLSLEEVCDYPAEVCKDCRQFMYTDWTDHRPAPWKRYSNWIVRYYLY